ncbi:MAG: hypothetical protein J5501_03770 [Ruminococcus sp.]|nr:hypothetical protein [Ruminococcus sp.]
MKAKAKIILFALFVGLIMFVANFEDSLYLIEDNTVYFNTSEISDYEKGALVEGDIYYPVGLMLTLEEQTSFLFIPTGNVKTFYYLVCNVGHDRYDRYMNSEDEELNEFYAIFSTSDEQLADKIDSLSNAWQYFYEKYENGEDVEYPSNEISFQGKLEEQPNDEEYKKIRDHCFEEWGFSPSEVATYRIAEGKVGVSRLILAILSIVLIIGSLILLPRALSGREDSKTEK